MKKKKQKIKKYRYAFDMLSDVHGPLAKTWLLVQMNDILVEMLQIMREKNEEVVNKLKEKKT